MQFVHNRTKHLILIGGLLITCLNACIKEYPNDAGDAWKPSYATPLASGDLTVSDLFMNSGLVENTDKSLVLVYRSQVSSQTGGSSFTIPNQNRIFTPT